ncbi:MAG: hypothetical protein QNJ90_14515 [Planctomycetota bacterium]|nr:hypothetical protein [Planctomycetota bacterium]
MSRAPARATRSLVLCLVVLLLMPACVMRHLHERRIKPYSRRTTTTQDLVYTAEIPLAMAVTVLTLGLVAPLDPDGTKWNDPDFWTGLFDEDDEDDDVHCPSEKRERDASTTRRHVGTRRSR